MSELPLEILTDILSRFPGKSIARFMCVSNSWLTLLGSYAFHKLLLRGCSQTNASLTLAHRSDDRLHLIDFTGRNNIFMTVKVDYDILREYHRLHHQEHCFKSSSLLGEYGHCSIDICGFSNGFLCLCSNKLFLWNPLTGKCQKLPSTSTVMKMERNRAFGFGYDAISDDYKVVMIDWSSRYGNTNEVMVYNLKSNSWHKVESIPKKGYPGIRNGILVNGSLHWVSYVDRHSSRLSNIVAFDLSIEQYKFVALPNCPLDGLGLRLSVHCLGGCLSVVCNLCAYGFEIWVMKEYGVEESWIKFVFRDDGMAGRLPIIFKYCRAIAFSKDGARVLVHDAFYHRILWFDLETNTFKLVPCNGVDNLGRVEIL